MKFKRFFSLLLSVLMIFSVASFAAASTSAAESLSAPTGYEGSGTVNDPYIANSSSDLYGFIHSDKNLYIKLAQNITITSTVNVESDITIDMNGKELSIKTNNSGSGIYISKYGKLTMTGSGKLKYEGKSALLSVYGTFESKGSVVYESKEVSMGVVAMYDYSIVRIYDGVFKGDRFFNHDQSKLYIYGGEFHKNVHTDKFASTSIYGGKFLDTYTNWGRTYIFDGVFNGAVSTYKNDDVDYLLLVNGYFKKGVTIGENARYKFPDNALCYSHKTKTAKTSLITNEEITIFSPYFEKQNPEMLYGKTEFDAGVIYEAIEDYAYGFKAKDVPKVFDDMGFSLEEKVVVKNSKGEVVYTQTETGKYAKGVEVKMNTLSADDYVIENTINLCYNGEVSKTAANTVKVKVNPLSNSDFGFKTLNPYVSEEGIKNVYIDLDDIYIGESLIFGFTPHLSQELADKGYNVKERVYVNYDNKGTLVTRHTGKEFDVSDYVDRTGDYQVWCSVLFYKGDEYVTGRTHIFRFTVVPLQKVSVLKAKVIAPSIGATPSESVNVSADGYEATKVDWSYFDEVSGEYLLMPEGMSFEEGKIYECCVKFEVLDGYTFAESKDYMAGYLNGIGGVISSVYSADCAYVTVQFALDKNKSVIFTEDSEPVAGGKLTVDVEAMAELDEEFMEAYFNDKISFKWFYDGRIFGNATDTFECKPGMVGHYVGVKVYYGDKSVSSEEFVIAEAPAVAGILGDANEDSTVNIKDATAIQKHIAGIITLTEKGAKLADVDASGGVNIKDATAIQKYVASIDTGFDIGKAI